MALNVSPIYRHLQEILKAKPSETSPKTTKTGASGISNQKLSKDSDSLSYDINKKFKQQDFDLKKDKHEQRHREMKERLKKLDVI
jgi:hypothetical protein